jgi:beta-glucosidase
MRPNPPGTYPLAALPGQTWIETRNEWQRHAVEDTRLGIPTSFIAETLHSGYAGGTNFPMPCLQGSTWDRPLVQAVAAVIGKEAAASGIDRGFSPVLHFCTDPRVGRCEESFGEDPMLISRMGEAAVTGLAGAGGAGAASTYLPEPEVHFLCLRASVFVFKCRAV